MTRASPRLRRIGVETEAIDPRAPVAGRAREVVATRGLAFEPLDLARLFTGGPHRFTADGLPEGMRIEAGALTGDPAAAGAYLVTIVATPERGGPPAAARLSLTVRQIALLDWRVAFDVSAPSIPDQTARYEVPSP